MLALLSVMASGCGVGTEAAPQVLGRHSVPFGLLAPATTTTTTPQPTHTQIVIYLAASLGIVPVTRTVQSAPASAQDVLKALSAGPTAAESSGGLTSALTSATPLRLSSIQGGVVSVDVPASFEALGGQEQIVAAAQLVFSLTALTGISGVVLLVSGQPTQVPTAGGSLSQGPLTRADYRALSPT